MTLATSKNLTIIGVLTIVGAVVAAALALIQGQPLNLEVTFTAMAAGIGMILGKGAASTGGTVNGAGIPVVDPAPPKPAP
jgi:hypothetical protein